MATYEKRQVFILAHDALKGELLESESHIISDGASGQVLLPKGEVSDEERKIDLYNGYNKFYQKYMNSLGHYFRNLYHIFKYIHTSPLTLDEKRFYATIIRAQLSSNELFLLFYNSIVPDLGYPKFLFLIREYDLLQNFDFKMIDRDSHIKVYEDLIEHAVDPYI